MSGPAAPGGWRLAAAIAWRYLRGQRSRLLSGTARAALAATAIGVAAMTVAMALMTGYRQELERKLIGANAAIVVYPLGGRELGPAELAAVSAEPGVREVRPVVFGHGAIESVALPQGVDVTVRGVDPGGEQLGGTRFDLRRPADGLPGVVVGSELAQRLGAQPGTVLRWAALGLTDGAPRFAFASLRVVGTFTTGFSEFDRAWAVADREEVKRVVGRPGAVWEVRLDDPSTAPATADRISERLGPHFLVSDWQRMNGELYTALRVQQLMLFLVLGLIVVVSTFNVASTLVVLVRERMRDVGVLEAMGLPPGGVRAVFVTYGGVLGAAGVLLGLGIGAGLSWGLDRFHVIRFAPEVAAIYFIRSVPFHVELRDLGAIAAFAVVANLLACLAPAWRASRVDPAAALRYE
ncbi:MAG: FtsX-like permease family protein [Acidobacteriota bacterium]